MTMVMERVSKSQFKQKALELFRRVQSTGVPLIITDRGHPVLKVVPFVEDPEAALAPLRKSVLRYEDPFEPVGRSDWEALD